MFRYLVFTVTWYTTLYRLCRDNAHLPYRNIVQFIIETLLTWLLWAVRLSLSYAIVKVKGERTYIGPGSVLWIIVASWQDILSLTMQYDLQFNSRLWSYNFYSRKLIHLKNRTFITFIIYEAGLEFTLLLSN